jgi:formylglycine-generating enzyme required for sulfatase activity
LCLGAIAVACAGCHASTLPPEGQIVFSVDTDAILPPAPGEPASVQMPIFDRLRIEIFPSGATASCDGCTREFGLDHAMVFDGKASFGIVPPPGDAGVRVRVRVYRSTGGAVVEPRPTSTLEAVVLLPALPSEGIVELHTVLHTDDLGSPQGTLDAPIDALLGPAEGGLAGTWAASYRKGCSGAPAAGEVCIPGGAYWMGNPTFCIPSEHLVVVSPFYLDTTEVTVASLRAAGFGTVSAVVGHDTTADCTYTDSPGSFDGYAVNCVTYKAAGDYCAAKGGRLPTEGEWEFVASARRSALYVWGDDAPACADAVYARQSATGQPAALSACLALGAGTQPTGTGARDRIDVDGGTVVDLMGNLSEWMADDWAEEGEPCWSASLLYNPLCTQESTLVPFTLTLRGANWNDPVYLLQAAVRDKIAATGTNKASTRAGFRCARPAD